MGNNMRERVGFTKESMYSAFTGTLVKIDSGYADVYIDEYVGDIKGKGLTIEKLSLLMESHVIVDYKEIRHI